MERIRTVPQKLKQLGNRQTIYGPTFPAPVGAIPSLSHVSVQRTEKDPMH